MPIGAHPAFDIHFVPPKGRKARGLALGILLASPFLVGLLALFLGQDANWDLRNYHWYNAYAYLNGRMGTMDLLPSQIPFFYNPTLDVPFYLAATHLPARFAAFLLGCVQGLNVVFLFMMAHATLLIPNPRQKVLACAGLAWLGLLGGGGIAQIGTTFYDNVTSLGLFASVLLIMRFLEALYAGPIKRALLLAFISGLPAGLMMGLKLPSVVFCVGLCFALLFVTGPLLRRFMLSFGFGVGVLVGCALSLGHWAVFLGTHFGNPLFPYFNDFFKSPFAAPVSSRDIKFIPQDWGDRLIFPLIFARAPMRVGEIPWKDLRIPLLYLLLPVAALLRGLYGRSRSLHDKMALPLPARYLLWVAVLSYVAWLVMFAIYRYALPLEMIAPLLVLYAVGLLPLRLHTRGLIAGFLLLVIASTIQPGNWTRRTEWLPSYQQVDIPAIPDPANTMILMAGYQPYAHIIPAFPPESPVLRIQSNFANPEDPIGMNDVLRDRIQAHKGRFLMVIPSYDLVLAENAVRHFRLTLLPQTCQKVQDHLYEESFALCDVQRLKTEKQ